ncbi:MAG TPA: hypothetical protein VKB26_14855 [Candidatus Acidoferrales bacterium]|nr:hypothetical protein [Candidatus Acidoferrales bacterium]
MWTYTIGVVAAMLPERWRAARFGELGVDWPRATAISALAEGFVAAALLVVWYSAFVTKYGGVIARAGGEDYSGFVALGVLALHPLTWVICYFGCEGAVRFLAAVATGESYGTLPLALVAWGMERGERKRRGQPVGDEVTIRTSEYDLQVASCRAKQHWRYPLTICYQEKFYQVMSGEVLRQGLRPYVYFLRRLPANEIIKGLEQYNPASAVDEATPGFFETVRSEVKRHGGQGR